MDVFKAAHDSLEYTGSNGPERDIDGGSLAHASWMLHGITMGYVQHEKAHRWLGYAQALIVNHGVASLADMKEINKRA